MEQINYETKYDEPKYTEKYKEKVDMLKGSLSEIQQRKIKHYNQFRNLQLTNTIIKTIINGLNAISVCSLVISLSPLSPATIFISLASTTIGGVISASVSALEIDNKIHSHQTSYLQYTGIYRDVSARLIRNGLDSQDLDNMLNDLNTRLSLIEDQSLPVTIV